MAQANLDIRIRVKDDGSIVIDRLTRETREFADAQDRLSGRLRTTGRYSREAETAFTRLAFTFKNVAAGMAVFYAIDRVTASFKFLVSEMVQVNAEAERTRIMLARLYGTAERGQEAFDWLVRFQARGVPFGVTALQDAFVKLKTAGLDPMAGSLQTILDAVAAMGGTDETLARVTRAIQQMAGKGRVSMEELRQQLGEHIPGAAQTMARELGMSLEDFERAVERGQIRAQEGIQALLEGWKREFGGATADYTNTWTGLVNQLAAKWKVFVRRVGDTGAFDSVLHALSQINLKLETMLREGGALDRFAKKLGGVIDAFFGPQGEASLSHERSILEWQLERADTPELRAAIQRRLDALTAADRAALVPPDPWLERRRRVQAMPPEQLADLEGQAKSHAQKYWEAYARAMAQLRKSAPAEVAPDLGPTLADLRRLDEMLNAPRPLPPVFGAGETSGLAFLRQMEAARESQERTVAALMDNATTNALRRLKEVGEEDKRIISEVGEWVKKWAEWKAKAERDWTDAARQGIAAYRDDALDVYDEVQAAVEAAFRGMEDALVRFVQTGKLSFKEFADAVIADLARIVIRAQITGPLAQMIGGYFGAPSQTQTPAPSSQPYPDALQITTPRTAGRVAAGTGGGVTVNVVNQVPGVAVEARERPGTGGTQIDVLISRLVAGDIDRGGDVAQTLQRVYGLSRRGY